MARTTAASIHVEPMFDAHGPCRVYLTSEEQRDSRGRSLWRCYFAVDGGRQKVLINSKPMIWREASRLAYRLNKESGLLDQPEEEVVA